ncbi:hypothetical protein GQ457_18G011030 [Hibiscus cannabinus]
MEVKKLRKVTKFGTKVNGTWLWSIDTQREMLADKVWKMVWAGLVPPKVEGFVWKLIHGRVPTLVELAKREIHQTERNLCVFCSKKEEKVHHLFCHCEVVWKVSSKWVNLWCIQLVVTGDILPVSSYLGLPKHKI